LSFPTTLRTLGRLTRRNRVVLAEVLTVEFVLVAALRMCSLRTVRRLRPTLARVTAWLPALSEPEVVWALDATARRLKREQSCLARALTVELLLGGAGEPVQVTIGVRLGSGGFDAHAWAERGGRVVVGELAGDASVRIEYTPVVTLP